MTSDPPNVPDSAITALRGEVAGAVITSADRDYDEARRLWNGFHDKRPAVIVRCASKDDIAPALAFARAHDLTVAVRGGGHSMAGKSSHDGGLVVDLSQMRRVTVDVARKLAVAEAGCGWGDVDTATWPHRLATTGGLVTHTGIAGLTLGGGIGWLMRSYGMTCDNLHSALLTTADGREVRASEDQNADLLWALKGGGGNFGVVSEFTYRLHDIPEFTAGMVFFAAEDGPEFLRLYRDQMLLAPEELTTQILYTKAINAPFVPEEHRGRRGYALRFALLGTPEEADALIKPFTDAIEPLFVGPYTDSYVTMQASSDATVPHGTRMYEKAHYLNELSDEAIDVMIRHAAAVSDKDSSIQIYQLGGAVARVRDEDTAFSGREAAYNVIAVGQWKDGEDDATDQEIDWVRGLFNDLIPHATGGVYVNFMSGGEEDRVIAAYGKAKYRRLSELKAIYDPENVFRLNANIVPRVEAGEDGNGGHAADSAASAKEAAE